jgi:hypothetical protein
MTVKAVVGEDHLAQIRFPDNMPAGECQLFVVAVSGESRRKTTVGDLLQSEIFGMWSDRTDIGDSAEYARTLRERAWKRPEE